MSRMSVTYTSNKNALVEWIPLTCSITIDVCSLEWGITTRFVASLGSSAGSRFSKLDGTFLPHRFKLKHSDPSAQLDRSFRRFALCGLYALCCLRHHDDAGRIATALAAIVTFIIARTLAARLIPAAALAATSSRWQVAQA